MALVRNFIIGAGSIFDFKPYHRAREIVTAYWVFANKRAEREHISLTEAVYRDHMERMNAQIGCGFIYIVLVLFNACQIKYPTEDLPILLTMLAIATGVTAACHLLRSRLIENAVIWAQQKPELFSPRQQDILQ